MDGSSSDRTNCDKCRSRTGKVFDLNVAIRATGDTPSRIREWPAIQSLLRDLFGYDHSDAKLWEFCTGCLRSKFNMEPNQYLQFPLSDIEKLLAEEIRQGSATAVASRRRVQSFHPFLAADRPGPLFRL